MVGVAVSCGRGGNELLKWVFYFVFLYFLEHLMLIYGECKMVR